MASLTHPDKSDSSEKRLFQVKQKWGLFWLLSLALIAGGILRSNWATRLDSYTFDEAYHIMAGASYVKTGSFRINPEHPPLTKLWVGAVVLQN